jgi:hypothetical protein
VAIPSDAIKALPTAHRIVLPNHDPAVNERNSSARSPRQCNARRRHRGRRSAPSYRRAPLSRSALALASARRNVHSPSHHSNLRAGAQPRGAAARCLLRVAGRDDPPGDAAVAAPVPRLSADLLSSPGWAVLVKHCDIQMGCVAILGSDAWRFACQRPPAAGSLSRSHATRLILRAGDFRWPASCARGSPRSPVNKRTVY